MKIVILDAQTLGDDIDLSSIQALGEVEIYPLTAPEEVEERIQDADVVIVNKVLLNETNLKAASKLKLIALFATGFNNINLDYAKVRGIGVVNVAGYSTKSVAQHTFAMLFNLLEQLSFYDHYVKSKAYATSETFVYIARPFYELTDKTWGIIGMGDIGKAVARLAEAFGTKVIYYSTSGKNHEAGYPCVDLETLLKTSDVISIHAPLNEYTENLIGKEALEKMKETAILINVGRGKIIDESALAQALMANQIRGVALDVLEKEPIEANHPLYDVDPAKWLVTPHIAWASVEARRTLVHEVALNIEAFTSGKVRNRLV
ncbi:MAG: D-2-hydroxyacid dehydrogenase [Niameybacter sp.]|uniref:D-2-hydroxyacid dehydrogenase n=1 Tax=Niameybacter sp. TaxID=2033640 RepID=UPI002FC6022D